MASRSQNSIREWDPMQEDFSNSNYDPQYQDDSSNEHVKLDHQRLYITNIPKALNDEGLRAAFSKFGTITEVFVTKNPVKRYGMVAFETPAEARHAMMKLNKTEPLRLVISIAHEKKDKKDSYTTGAGRSVSNTGRSVSNTGQSVNNTGRSTSTREQSASYERNTRERDDNIYETRWKSSSRMAAPLSKVEPLKYSGQHMRLDTCWTLALRNSPLLLRNNGALKDKVSSRMCCTYVHTIENRDTK